MIKPHINDTELFKSLTDKVNGYAALTEISLICKRYRDVNCTLPLNEILNRPLVWVFSRGFINGK